MSGKRSGAGCLKLSGETVHTLILRGERRWAGEGEQFHRLESSYGKFERQFGLSERIDVDGITAELQRGVLKLVLPKRNPGEPARHIKVATE